MPSVRTATKPARPENYRGSHVYGIANLTYLLPGSALAPLVPAVVERLVLDVGDEAEPECGAGMIEDQTVRLALGRPEPSNMA